MDVALCFIPQMKCWVCGNDARTGEHTIKRSDLRAIFGHVSQDRPLYRHTAKKRNVPVKGLNVGLLKSGGPLCALCNNQHTQPFDFAWARLSAALRAKAVIRAGECIDLGKVFPGSVKRSMLHVHLYFVKLFGCLIAENALPVDIEGFSQAILNNSAHPKVHLAISPLTYGRAIAAVGYSDLRIAELEGHTVFATWLLTLDKFTVRVMYAEATEHRKGPSTHGIRRQSRNAFAYQGYET